MSDNWEKAFGEWFSLYGHNYDNVPPPQSPNPTPNALTGFSAFSNSPSPFGGGGFSGQRNPPDSTPDSQRFGRFPTPPTGSGQARVATQGLESMNLAASFESVSNQPEVSSPTKGKAKAKGKGKAKAPANETKRPPMPYSPAETACLAYAWVAISEDPIVGTDQTNTQLWRRIEAMYMKNKPQGTVERDDEMLKSHWKRVVPKIREFNDIYNKELNSRASGNSDSDVYNKAQAVYYEAKKAHFVLEEAWKILHKIPKFQNPGSDKRQKGMDGSSHSSRSGDDSGFFSHDRPVGRDSSKSEARGKGKATASSATDEIVTEMADSVKTANWTFIEWAKNKMEMGKLKARRKYKKAQRKDTSEMTPEELEDHLEELEILKKLI